MMVESRTHACIGANYLPELNQSRQQLPLCDTRHGENYPASDEREIHQARGSPPRCLSDSPTNVDPCIGGLGFGGANLPIPGHWL